MTTIAQHKWGNVYYDIKSGDDKSQVDTLFRRWISDAEGPHNAMSAEWNSSDNYFENDQVPPGFSEAHAQNLVDANDPAKGNITSKQYVVFNKVLMSHERTLGEFVNGNKTLIVKARTLRDRRIAGVIKAEMEFVQDSTNMWDEAVVPCIDSAIRRGIHWLKVRFDPFQDLPYGRIVVEEISCRDVLIDPNSRKTFYQDKHYVIHRKRYLIEDAETRYGDMLSEGSHFSPDNRSDQSYQNAFISTAEQFCTIYEIQYHETETHYYLFSEDNEYKDITRDQFDEAKKDPGARDRVFAANMDVQYVAFFNEGVGCFYLDQNEFDTCTLIPLSYIKSESRLYPLGSGKYDHNLQDLINVFISVMLDNTKRGNRGIISVDPNSWNTYQDQILAAINNPGTTAIPANVFNVSYPRELPPAMVTLFGLISNAFEEVQAEHSLTKGEMPRERLAKETVNLLLSQDRKSHGRKDVMIRWTLTQVARLIYRMIVAKWGESHWARTTGMKIGDENFVPINFKNVPEQEYHRLLIEMGEIESPPPNPSQDQLQQFEDAVFQYKRKFEKSNDVKYKRTTNMFIAGKKMTVDQAMQMQKDSGLTEAEFKMRYNPQIANEVMVDINDISRNPDVDFIWSIDFNFERDRESRMNRSMMLFDRHTISGRRLNEDLEYPDAEQTYKEAQAESQIVQVGTEVVNNPRIYQMVIQALREIEMKKSNGSAQVPQAQ